MHQSSCMGMDERDPAYLLLLDLFPLTDEVIESNHVLGDAIQRTALLLLSSDTLQKANAVRELSSLLSLSRDLGCASPEVVGFLLRHIARLR